MKKIHLILIGLLIWASGNCQNSDKYTRLHDFNNGLWFVVLSGKYGVVDEKGNEVIPLKYDDANWWNNGLVLVKLSGKYGFIDEKGNEVIPPKYEDADYYLNGLWLVKLNGKYGLIDEKGNEVIPPKYEDVHRFNKGLAAVKLNGKWGFIDKTGKERILLSPIYDYYSRIKDRHQHTSGGFNISRPYLIIDYGGIIDTYSEGDFNEQSIDGLKTLIVEYDYISQSKEYHSYSNGSWGSLYNGKVNITSQGKILVYFDMKSMKCIGYDKIDGPKLPKTITSIPDFRPDQNKIDQKVKSHLTTSE